MQKEIENLEVVRGLNFEFDDSIKNNGTKYLLIFDDSREECRNSKASVDIATVGRHRGLSTIFIKHNLFHQSKLGRDVDVQNTHIVLFKCPRNVMQVNTLSTQLGLGSELVDWYRDAKSVPFSHLLIDLSTLSTQLGLGSELVDWYRDATFVPFGDSLTDLSPRTHDRSRYCTNTGSIHSKF